RFMWRTKKSAREKMQQLVATAPSACRVVCLRSNRDIGIFLASMGSATVALQD
ncbi:AAA family ATPase, partial [Pseudomonas protegens]